MMQRMTRWQTVFSYVSLAIVMLWAVFGAFVIWVMVTE